MSMACGTMVAVRIYVVTNRPSDSNTREQPQTGLLSSDRRQKPTHPVIHAHQPMAHFRSGRHHPNFELCPQLFFPLSVPRQLVGSREVSSLRMADFNPNIFGSIFSNCSMDGRLAITDRHSPEWLSGAEKRTGLPKILPVPSSPMTGAIIGIPRKISVCGWNADALYRSKTRSCSARR